MTINLSNNTVIKNVDVFALTVFGRGETHYQDTFNNIQTFIGSSSGNTTFDSIGTGYYTFTGRGTNNTLAYSADTSNVTINLTNDTVMKSSYFGTIGHSFNYQDTFSGIQNFVGNANAHDTIIFDGASSQYNIVDNSDGSLTVTDTVAGRNDSVHVDLIGLLQFTDKTIAAV